MSGFIAGFYREIVNPLVRHISADPILVLKTYQQDLAELEGHAESIDSYMHKRSLDIVFSFEEAMEENPLEALNAMLNIYRSVFQKGKTNSATKAISEVQAGFDSDLAEHISKSLDQVPDSEKERLISNFLQVVPSVSEFLWLNQDLITRGLAIKNSDLKDNPYPLNPNILLLGQPHENPTTISIFIRVIRRNIIEATPEQLKLAGYEDFIGRVCKEKIPVGSGSDMKFYQTMFEEVRRKLVLALTKDAREAVLTPSVDSDGTVQKKLTSIFRRANQLCINDSDPIQVVGTNFKGFQLMRIERQKENLATSPTFYILRGTTTLAKEHFVRAASLEALHSTLQATVFGDAALHFRVATPDELNQLISELETTYGPECSYQQYSPLG